MDTFENGVLGKATPVADAALKVTGQLKYVDDMKLPGMLYAKVLFSPVAHAEIISIDVSEAEKLEGVHAVVCYKDAPQVRYNGNGEDSDILPSELVFDRIVRYVGDKVAAVAAESPAIAQQALKLIHVEYRELPFYLDPEEAAASDAYPIHEQGNILEEIDMSVGDVEQGLLDSDFVVAQKFEVPAIHHAAMEPHVSLSIYEADGKLTVYTPSQDVFGQRKNLSKIFSMPMNRIRVINPAMGGGFGGKIDLVTEPISALLAIKTIRPVKLVYTRREDMQSSLTRHAEKIYIKTGLKKTGEILACDYKVYLSAGAQSGATMSVVWAAGGKFFKLFKTPNMHYHAIPAYTNREVAGAMRGFGSPQLFFSMNNQLNTIAKKMKIDMCELVLKNLHDPNTCDKKGEPLGNLRAKECVKRGMELFDWQGSLNEQKKSKVENGRYRIGIGMAVSPHGSSLFGVMPDTCGVMIKMNEDGSITLFTGVSDMGNGSTTTQMMLTSEILGISMERIACMKTDTETTLFDVGAYASRGTYVGGNAAVKVAKKVKTKILREGSELLGCSRKELALANDTVYMKNNPKKKVTMQQIAEHAHEKERDISVSDMFGTKAAPISAGAHFVKVQVDTETGKVTPIDYVAVHDVGKPLNPMNLEGQVHGGIYMGLGYALSEGLVLKENGEVAGKFLRDCHLFHTTQMPKIRVDFLNSYEKTGPYGGKSVGECATVPAAAAVVNAVSNAVDCEFCNLPVRESDVLCKIKQLLTQES